MPFVEVYQVVQCDNVLNKDLKFQKGDLEAQLVDPLWSVRGCSASSVEVMMNYYKVLTRRRINAISTLRKRAREANG